MTRQIIENLPRFVIRCQVSGCVFDMVNSTKAEATLKDYRRDTGLGDQLEAWPVPELKQGELLVLCDNINGAGDGVYGLQARGHAELFGSLEELADAVRGFFSSPQHQLPPGWAERFDEVPARLLKSER